ncbi:hypothetical protein JAAARDRAFT_50071 [Jaapia argillacea MUCL 33604]|uniref:Uncharacterized protein n=1 Tax=Jaapia argillacea MUCL 33604 TaxID=933084 RepID=A0A067PDJ1_9AGAM|nr:hypothetical protein JAAARDRAFT_50071 [Jaapia argillacea MUCL 33604]
MSVGEIGLLCTDRTVQLQVDHNGRATAMTCEFCVKAITGTKDAYRSHIGLHLLHRLRKTGLHEPLPSTTAQLGDTLPCGFCGKSGDSRCLITISIQRKDKMYRICSFANANKGTKNNPSHNVPIHCKLCPHPDSFLPHVHPAVWRYNMDEHLAIFHQEYASLSWLSGQPLPKVVWDELEITSKEEDELGIPRENRLLAFIQFVAEEPVVEATPSTSCAINLKWKMAFQNDIAGVASKHARSVLHQP